MAKRRYFEAFGKVSGCLGTVYDWAIYVFQMSLKRATTLLGVGGARSSRGGEGPSRVAEALSMAQHKALEAC